jgi:hypothetical protein
VSGVILLVIALLPFQKPVHLTIVQTFSAIMTDDYFFHCTLLDLPQTRLHGQLMSNRLFRFGHVDLDLHLHGGGIIGRYNQ